MANPYFNAVLYLKNNPDVFSAGYTIDTAEQHYLQYGAFEANEGVASRNPAPWFDVQYYLASNPDLIAAGITPAGAFAHFTTYGIDEGRQPSNDFVLDDAALSAYAAANEDLLEAFDIDDPADLTEAQQDLLANHYYQYGYKEGRPGTPDLPDTGDTFTLTTDIDNLVGTSGDDTFQGILVNDDSATVNTFDKVDGGAGTDTLDIVVRPGDGAPGIPGNIGIKNVEIVNLLSDGGSVAAEGGVNAALFGDALQEIWQVGGSAAVDVSNLQDGQVAGFRSIDDLTAVVGYAAAADNAAIAIDNGSVTTVDGITDVTVTGAGLDAVTVSGSLETGATGPGLNVDPDAEGTAVGTLGANDYDAVGILDLNIEGAGGTSGIETLNLALSTDTVVLVGNGFDNIQTIDASGSTGGIIGALAGSDSTIQLSSIIGGSGDDMIIAPTARFENDASIATGAGNDTVVLVGEAAATNQSDFVVDAGQGNDTLVVISMGASETDISLTGGAGGDTFVVAGSNLGYDGDDFIEDQGFTTITDFGTGSDVLGLVGFNGFTAQNLINQAIDGAESLYDAVVAVSGVAVGIGENITDFAQFEFDGDTYVYEGVGSVGGESLIQLTGDVSLNNDNVVDAAGLIGAAS